MDSDRTDPDESELEYELQGITSVEDVTRAYERDLLWCLLNGEREDRVAAVLPIVEPGDFLNHLHGRLFRGIVELQRRDRLVDGHAVLELLSTRQGADEVRALTLELWASHMPGGDPHPWRVEHYARRVHQKAVARRLVEVTRAESEALRGRAARLPNGDRIEPQTPASQVVAQTAKARRELMREQDAASHAKPIGAFRERALADEEERTMSTGLAGLNLALRGGMRGGELNIVGARPAMGKTALALGLVDAFAGAGLPGLVFSLEMTGAELYRRLVARRAEVSQQDWSGAETQTWERMLRVADDIDRLGIRLCDDSGVAFERVQAEAERLHAEGRLRWVMVDYLGLMANGDADRHDLAIAHNTKGLKGLAKAFDVPVVLLSQLSREVEKRQNKRPVMADLRDSGSVEQDADVVLMLYREVVYDASADPDRAEIIVAKQRNGPPSTVEVRWNGPLTRFEDAGGPDDGLV